jgi:DNA-binding protein
MMPKEQNVIYIGRKPVMSYVLAIITGFTSSGTSEVALKARGMAITTAVDAAEVTRRKFMKDLQVSRISIGTEELPQEHGMTRAVSTMEITLTRIPSTQKGEKEKNEGPEPGIPIQPEELTSIAGIGIKRAEKLRSCGVSSVQDLAKCDARDLSEKLQVSEKRVSTWIEDAKKSL